MLGLHRRKGFVDEAKILHIILQDLNELRTMQPRFSVTVMQPVIPAQSHCLKTVMLWLLMQQRINYKIAHC